MEKKQQQCLAELFACKSHSSRIPTTMNLPGNCQCGPSEQLHARLQLVESNFTQTIQRMRREMDQTVKERDNINLEAIHLRREKSSHEKEVNFFRQKCKDDFSQSLSGISNVSKSFLEKIDSLFPSHIAFQLTCPNQREHLEQIRTNCTSLSMEVEDRFQRYLNNVGEKVSNIQAESSRLKAENKLLSDDYRRCSTNRTGLIREHKQNLDKLQQKHDEDKEKLLMDKLKLHGDIEVLNNHVKYTSRVIDHLTEQNKQLNISCVSKTGLIGLPSVSTYGTGAGVLGPKIASTGTGYSGSSLGSSSSFGSAFNKPASTGTGSSSSSLGSSSSFGSAFNKPASTGTGSSSSSSGSSSSFGSAFNKPASTGTGSSSSSSGSSSSFGSAFNKPASTGTGSSSSSLGSSSSFGSAFNKPASTGTGSSSSSLGSSSFFGSAFNKPASTGTGSSSSSSGSSSSFGSAFNKLASTGTGSSSSSGSSTGLGSSGSNPSSSGSGLNKPALTSGRSSSSSGTSSGSSGIGSNKPTTSLKSSSGLGASSGSSSGSTGSTSKSSGFGWFGQSKTGSGTGKGPSTGNSNTGLGSSSGAGRTSGLGGGSISVAQHLRDLQRIINPSEPEEKQALSRIMG
ncbi:Nuclear pore complex protein Nup98-Nup96 [Dissostichus eleginoides]|uniref:Nuclear pore complex protein Nup98-Nup96 n=1 Tax=Dissostichus eleginoides TaxID=100907 RepID=A0AAD9EW20_DISEL|nr:Nuclear pore complex protein Nup98-Nup96 [Dissostichus eleginoides]